MLCNQFCTMNADCRENGSDCCISNLCTNNEMCLEGIKIQSEYCDHDYECISQFCYRNRCDIIDNSKIMMDYLIKIVAFLILAVACLWCILGIFQKLYKKPYNQAQVKRVKKRDSREIELSPPSANR